jgi:branched-chain amino acid transport system ATP-binding protein
MTALLEIEGVETSYGRSQVLFGMSLAVAAGEVVTLMGRNGMGKTTTIRSILGLTRAAKGSIRMAGVELRGQPCFKVARHGIGIVPEGRQVFPNLSVLEHLLVAASNRGGRAEPWTPPKVFALFPRLAERQGNLGNQLSGGEQQMLAIGRALMTNPRLLILDEATEGLAPLVREEIWTCIEALKADGQSILLVDKNLDALTRIADRHVIIEKGRVAWTGTSAELLAAPEMQQRYLGV